MTLQEIIQQEVNQVCIKKYNEDETLPKFTVSIMENNFVLMVEHLDSCFSEIIFPEKDMRFGLSNLEDIMTNLYNRTM